MRLCCHPPLSQSQDLPSIIFHRFLSDCSFFCFFFSGNVFLENSGLNPPFLFRLTNWAMIEKAFTSFAWTEVPTGKQQDARISRITASANHVWCTVFFMFFSLSSSSSSVFPCSFFPVSHVVVAARLCVFGKDPTSLFFDLFDCVVQRHHFGFVLLGHPLPGLVLHLQFSQEIFKLHCSIGSFRYLLILLPQESQCLWFHFPHQSSQLLLPLLL